MKGILTLRKSAVIAAVCMAVLCLPGYSDPTPEQVKERTEMLLQALKTNDVERAKVCIKLGADMNAKDNVGGTALMWAASRGYKDIAELLIKSGADVNAKNNNGRTALESEIINKKKDVAEMLIKAGANVNATDNEGLTLLTHAILYGKNDIADLLRAAGAKE